MAVANSVLRSTELNFNQIKTNLINFLRAKPEFVDYDFEGSALNTLVDLLAYNTYYNAMYTNMATNEMFLDSASLRSSIVSHAKQLGYEVQSARAPKATLSISVKTSAATITMSAGTKFSTTLDGDTYNFVTTSDITKPKFGLV